VKGPCGGFGRYAVIILSVWFPLPWYLDQHQRPRLDSSQPFPITLWAALSIEKRADPPYCLVCLGSEFLLWAQLTCCCVHHSLVLVGNLSCSFTSLQSKLISAIPKTSKSHRVKPCLILSSFSLPLWVGNPPIFWNPTLRMFFSLTSIQSPKLPTYKSPVCRSPRSSDALLLSEDSSNGLLTLASDSWGVAGYFRLWVVGLFRLVGDVVEFPN